MRNRPRRSSEHLFADYPYTSRRKLKRLLSNYYELYENALRGDLNSLVLFLDLKQAVFGRCRQTGSEILTPKQREIIKLNLIEGYSENEIAEMLMISQQAVSARLASGLSNLIYYFAHGKARKPYWTDEEVEFLIENYEYIGASECAKELKKSVKQIYNKVQQLRKQGLM